MAKNFSELTPTSGLAHKKGIPPFSGMECFYALKAMFDGKHLMFGSFFLPLLLLLPLKAKGQNSVSGTDRGTQEKITTSSAAASQQKADAPSSTVSDKTSVRSKRLSPEECMKIVQEDTYKKHPELREYDLVQAERRKSEAQQGVTQKKASQSAVQKASAPVAGKKSVARKKPTPAEKRKSQAQQRPSHKKTPQPSLRKGADPGREKMTLARQHSVPAQAKKSDAGQRKSSGKDSKLLAQRQSSSSKRTKSATRKSPSRPKAKNLQVREGILQSRVIQALDPPAFPPIDPSLPKVFARIESSSRGARVSADVHESLVQAGQIELVVCDGQSGVLVFYGEMVEGVTSPDGYVRFEVTCPASCFKNEEIYLFRVNQWGPCGGRQLTGFPSSVYFKENDPDTSVRVEKSPVKHQTTLHIVPAGNGAKFVVRTTEKPRRDERIYIQVYDPFDNFYAILPMQLDSKHGDLAVYTFLEKDMSQYLSVPRERRFRVYLGELPLFEEAPTGRQLSGCKTDLSHFPFYHNYGELVLSAW